MSEEAVVEHAGEPKRKKSLPEEGLEEWIYEIQTGERFITSGPIVRYRTYEDPSGHIIREPIQYDVSKTFKVFVRYTLRFEEGTLLDWDERIFEKHAGVSRSGSY